MAKHRYLGEILLSINEITQENLDRALNEQKELNQQNKPVLLGELLLNKCYVTQKALNKALQISLLETIDDKDTKPFIKDAAKLALDCINKMESGQQCNDNKLTEEGKYALIYRLKNFTDQFDYFRTSMTKSAALASNTFRDTAIENYKVKIIETEQKINLLKRDLELFT